MIREKSSACLLLGTEHLQRAKAYLGTKGYEIGATVSEQTAFVLAEGEYVRCFSDRTLARCRTLSTPLFLLLEPGERVPSDLQPYVTYVFYGPWVLELVLRRIGILLGESETGEGLSQWFRLQAQCSLDSLSVPRHLLAFTYFSDGVGLLSEWPHPSRIKLMHQLYPALSQRHGSSAVMVDRAMRHGVESCWRLAGKSVQRQYFGYCAQDKQGMPTNGEFLFALYEHVKMLIPCDRGQAAFERQLWEINARDEA